MSFIDNFLDMMPHEVVIHTKGEHTRTGNILPGPDIKVKGYVDGRSNKIVDVNGTDVVSSAVFYSHAYLGDLELEATVTLPQGFYPRQNLKVLKIDPLDDESGPQGSVLYLK